MTPFPLRATLQDGVRAGGSLQRGAARQPGGRVRHPGGDGARHLHPHTRPLRHEFKEESSEKSFGPDIDVQVSCVNMLTKPLLGMILLQV